MTVAWKWHDVPGLTGYLIRVDGCASQPYRVKSLQRQYSGLQSFLEHMRSCCLVLRSTVELSKLLSQKPVLKTRLIAIVTFRGMLALESLI